MNPFRNDLVVIPSPHLTDSDAWFLMAEPGQNGIRIIERKPLETKAGGDDVGFINDSILYKARYREALGAFSYLGMYGSPGA